MGRVQDGGHHLGHFQAVYAGLEAQIHGIQIVFHEIAGVEIAVLKRVQRDVDDVVEVLHFAAAGLPAGDQLLAQHARHFQPVVVHLDELAQRRTVAQQADLGGFAEHADCAAGGVVLLVEEAAFDYVQAVNDGVGRPHTVQLRNLVGRLGQHARGTQRAPGRQRFQLLDVGRQDAHVAVGESRRIAAALLQFLLAGGGPRLHQHIAYPQLFNEAQGFLARTGADGQHADHRAHAENDTQRGQQRTRFLGAQVIESLRGVGEDPAESFHCDKAFMALPLVCAFWCSSSGLASATTWPSLRPVSTTWLSLRRTSLTSRGVKPEGVSR